jgi:hypothetical protein
MAILTRAKGKIYVITRLPDGRGAIGHSLNGGILAWQKIKTDPNEAEDDLQGGTIGLCIFKSRMAIIASICMFFS